MNNIINVVKEGLCTGCGTCVGLCPQDIIKMEINHEKGLYFPNLGEGCNDCGICLKVCPGHEVDFKQLNEEIFGKNPENYLIGNYLKIYIGHSMDEKIRNNSSSGGLITQMLIFALEEGLIDGAMVTRMKRNDPLKPETFIARTKEDIIESSQSKYCPVPLNIGLKDILKSKNGEKFAIVGLPCHIQGLRKAEETNKILKDKIILRFGIFCNHTPNFWATSFFIKKLGIKKDDLTKINYRGKGWPGYLSLLNKKKEEISINSSKAWKFIGSDYFLKSRCILCNDALCELSDISFGDAWLPELNHDKEGTSIIITKNADCDNLLKLAKLKHKIDINLSNTNSLLESQEGVLLKKKKYLKSNLSFFKLIGKKTPKYYEIKYNSPLYSYLSVSSRYIKSRFSTINHLRKLILYFK